MKNFDDFDDDYTEDIDIKNIYQLYELRHACNVLGVDFISKNLKINQGRIFSLINSNLHGSIFISDLLNLNKEEYKKAIKEIKKEELEIQLSIEKAHQKNEELIFLLKEKRKTFAGIGTNKAKRRLNKLSKSSNLAKSIRLSLEIEDKNISAKDNYYYRDRIYELKNQLIEELVKIFINNNWTYGVHESTNPSASHIIFFEIPDCDQISWHFTPKEPEKYPKYEKEWDKKENSTLDKLEKITKIVLEKNEIISKKKEN